MHKLKEKSLLISRAVFVAFKHMKLTELSSIVDAFPDRYINSYNSVYYQHRSALVKTITGQLLETLIL